MTTEQIEGHPAYYNGFKEHPAPVEEGETPPQVVTGLVILNVCNVVEQRIQFNLIGDD